MDVVKCFNRPMDRQISEGCHILSPDADIMMNGKLDRRWAGKMEAGGDQHGGAEREEEEQKSWLSQKNFFMLTQFFILTQFVSFDNFHFLISPVYILKLVDFASADQDPRGR